MSEESSIFYPHWPSKNTVRALHEHIREAQDTEEIPGLKFRNPPAPEEQPLELELHIWPDPILSAPVMDFPENAVGTPIVKRTLDKMVELMYNFKGVGLAAQQVGVPFRCFVIDAQVNGEKKPRQFLNPQITEVGEEVTQVVAGEGCLSFPYGVRHPVKRFNKVELQWIDFDGSVKHEWFEGHEAVIIQHEMDHLLGYLFLDRVSWLRRDLAKRKARGIRNRYKKGIKQGLSQMKNAPRTPAYNLKRAAMFEAGFRAGEALKEQTNDQIQGE